jgi:hypothetical protein
MQPVVDIASTSPSASPPLSPEFVESPISPAPTSTPVTPVMATPVQPAVLGTPTVITTTTIPLDCKAESDQFWNCFDPTFMETKKDCRTQCLKECTNWLAQTGGLLSECQEILHEGIDIYPIDVAVTTGTHVGPTPEVLETEGVTSFTVPSRYLYSTEKFSTVTKEAVLRIRNPMIKLAIETPGYYLYPSGQRQVGSYISHFITPMKLGDDLRWQIRPTVGDDGHPLSGISAAGSNTQIFDLNGAAEEICNLMGVSNSKALVIQLSLPFDALRTTFSNHDQMLRWWNLFRKVRVIKNGVPWFPPGLSGGLGDVPDEFLFFLGKPSTPFTWSVKLSLRHLLLFYLLKTKPEGTPLTHLVRKSITYSTLPNHMTSFFHNWYNLNQ